MAGAAPTEQRAVNVDEPDVDLGLVEESVDDRGGLPAADAQEPAAQPTDEPSVSDLRSAKSLFDQARDEISERAAKARAERLGLSDDPASTTDGGTGSPVDDGSRPAAAGTKIAIKVHGTEMMMDLADAQRIVQESLAGERVALDTAKAERERTIREAAVVRGDAPRNEPAQTTDQPDPAPKKTTLDPARLTQVVDRLQVGTPEEAAEELGSFLNEELDRRMAAATPQPAGSIDDQVDQVLERRNAARRTQVALSKFAQDFKAIAADEDLTDITMKQFNREIIADFERIGVPAEDIEAAKKNPALVIEGYQQLSSQMNPKTGKSWGLRGVDALLNAAGTTVAKRFGLEVAKAGAEPGQINVDVASRRQARDALSQQPRSAGLRADAGRLNGQQQPSPLTRTPGSQIVQEERRARGLPT